MLMMMLLMPLLLLQWPLAGVVVAVSEDEVEEVADVAVAEEVEVEVLLSPVEEVHLQLLQLQLARLVVELEAEVVVGEEPSTS